MCVVLRSLGPFKLFSWACQQSIAAGPSPPPGMHSTLYSTGCWAAANSCSLFLFMHLTSISQQAGRMIHTPCWHVLKPQFCFCTPSPPVALAPPFLLWKRFCVPHSVAPGIMTVPGCLCASHACGGVAGAQVIDIIQQAPTQGAHNRRTVRPTPQRAVRSGPPCTYVFVCLITIAAARQGRFLTPVEAHKYMPLSCVCVDISQTPPSDDVVHGSPLLPLLCGEGVPFRCLKQQACRKAEHGWHLSQWVRYTNPEGGNPS